MSKTPLYRRVLGEEAWSRLPAPIRDLHALDGDMLVEGVADVERGRGPAARLIAALIGFPQAGRDVAVSVAFRDTPQGEIWRRTFAGRAFQSVQSEGTGRFAGLVVERFGPIAFGLAFSVEGERLVLRAPRWSLFGLPMPPAWVPLREAYETVEDGRFRFHVEIGHPAIGPVVRYRGWLAPQGASAAA